MSLCHPDAATPATAIPGLVPETHRAPIFGTSDLAPWVPARNAGMTPVGGHVIDRTGARPTHYGRLPTQMAAKTTQMDMDRAEKDIKRKEGIIQSMTPKERRHPDLIKATRKRRIAAGAGVQVQDVNRMLKEFEQMQGMMKKMKGGGMMKMMKQLGGMKGMGGMPKMPF